MKITFRVIFAATAVAIALSTPPHTLADEKKTPAAAKADAAFALRGTWTHNIPWGDGKERTITLIGSMNSHSQPIVEMDAPFFPYKPIFREYLAKDGQVEITFVMVRHDDEAVLVRHKLKYVLKQTDGVWSGQFTHLWQKAPTDVTLKKL